MYYKPTKFDKNRSGLFFDKIKNCNTFLCELLLNFLGTSKTKKRAGYICKGTLHIEFEQDWSVGWGVTSGDGKKIKNYFFIFKDFFGKRRYCHIVGFRMYYKPTKFNQNR